MKLLEKILAPVNFDNPSHVHLETAAKLAEKFNSHLILVHVLPEDAKKGSVKSILNKFIDSSFREIIKNYDLEKFQPEQRLLYGNTFNQIISTAENENVNLILISNHSESAESCFHIDLLAEKLIRKSQKPVWVVKEGDKPFPENILCSVDFSDASQRALTNAIKIAKTFKARLNIVNVFEPMRPSYSLRFEIDYEGENARRKKLNEQRFKEFLDKFTFIDLDYRTQILEGSPEKEILNFIAHNHNDLLLMGATGKTYMQRIVLGSVTENILRELPCSMVITKSENILNLRIDADILALEKHIANARKLEDTGYYEEAIEQLKLSLQINDLHIPALHSLVKLYKKTGQEELAKKYQEKIDEILRRLWNKKIEFEIRKTLKL